MRVLKLTLSYDGTDFSGWQVQPGRRTVQEVLERTLGKITGSVVRATASGRTDAGVHALGQVVSVPIETHLTVETLGKALNAELPDDVAVLAVEEAAADFHAIRDAAGKRYRYVIDNGPVRDVHRRRFAWHLFTRLDERAMHEAAQALCGRHDFSSFETSGAGRASSVRHVTEMIVRRDQLRPHLIHLEVEADGFLYNMVRAIVGTLVEVGRGARPTGWPAEVLAAQDRGAAGATAPPQGLVLLHVNY